MSEDNNVTGWVGWVLFAGIILMIRGLAQALFGLGTLLNNNFLLVTQTHVAVVNVTTWGWIHLLLGVLLLGAGYSVMHGNAFGRIIGVILTAIAVVANLIYLPAYPFWSTILIVVDILILYALVVHGKEARVE